MKIMGIERMVTCWGFVRMKAEKAKTCAEYIDYIDLLVFNQNLMSARQNKPQKASDDAISTPADGNPQLPEPSIAGSSNGKHAHASAPSSSATAAVKLEDMEVVRRILRALAGLDYGSVEIIVQDSRVVQIERTQRSRFARPLEIPQPQSQAVQQQQQQR